MKKTGGDRLQNGSPSHKPHLPTFALPTCLIINKRKKYVRIAIKMSMTLKYHCYNLSFYLKIIPTSFNNT
jgi:hypothetical protein